MRFMLLMLREPDATRREWSDDREREAYRRMVEWGDGLEARGMVVASDALCRDSDGIRVRVRDGERAIVDGPFAETKEVVGGYVIVECGSKEDAVALAARCPHAEWGTVEVRAIRVGPDVRGR